MIQMASPYTDFEGENFAYDNKLVYIYCTRSKKYHFITYHFPYWGRGAFVLMLLHFAQK